METSAICDIVVVINQSITQLVTRHIIIIIIIIIIYWLINKHISLTKRIAGADTACDSVQWRF